MDRTTRQAVIETAVIWKLMNKETCEIETQVKNSANIVKKLNISIYEESEKPTPSKLVISTCLQQRDAFISQMRHDARQIDKLVTTKKQLWSSIIVPLASVNSHVMPLVTRIVDDN